jgi:flagellar protein FliS
MACIRDVREAWDVAARDPEVLSLLERETHRAVMTAAAAAGAEGQMATRWSA